MVFVPVKIKLIENAVPKGLGLKINLQLTIRKTRPPLVTVDMTDKQCSSHSTHIAKHESRCITD